MSGFTVHVNALAGLVVSVGAEEKELVYLGSGAEPDPIRSTQTIPHRVMNLTARWRSDTLGSKRCPEPVDVLQQ